MPEYCDFLQGVCVLQSAIHEHLISDRIYNPEVAELIKNCGGIKFIPYDAQADETATALITMRRDNIVLGGQANLAGSKTSSAFRPNIGLQVHISTQSYYFTEKLGQELLQYVASIQSAMRAFNLNIGSLALSPTTNNKEASPNYFINTLAITGSIPLTMWKIQTSDDILSCIRTNITFNGQNILS